MSPLPPARLKPVWARTGQAVAWLLILGVMACSRPPSPRPQESVGPSVTAGPMVTSDKAATDCEAFEADPSGSFYTPTDVSFQDAVQPAWPIGTPTEVGLDEELLAAAADNAALSPVVQSMVVVRHGKLVFERYFNGSDAGEANAVASMSKSILSVVTGIAIDEGLLDLDSRIDEFLPSHLVGGHGDLTVENLLTMSGGLRLNEPEWDYDPADSFVRAALARPAIAAAGSEFAYSTGLTQVLAAVVTEAAGMSLCAYASTRLLGELGIDVERWWVEPGGYDSGGHSLFITPREIARLGQLVLEDGRWNGRQLVPKPWLDLTLAERWDLGCRGVRPVHFGYGYLWWPLDVDGHLVWQASGYGSQQLWIVPAMDLLLVVTHDAASVGDPARQEVNDYALARAAILSAAKRHYAETDELVIRIDQEGDGTKAVLVHYSCEPSILGPSNREIEPMDRRKFLALSTGGAAGAVGFEVPLSGSSALVVEVELGVALTRLRAPTNAELVTNIRPAIARKASTSPVVSWTWTGSPVRPAGAS